MLEQKYAGAVAGDVNALRTYLAQRDVAVAHHTMCAVQSLHSGILAHCATSDQAREWQNRLRTVLPELPSAPPPPLAPPGTPGL
ncbi:hypothetical protein OG288_17440 [Streptomyces tauricus]|uniref:Uncharacterized protein n=1 Tax=Streptomyces tauricus TaxID=68274 RepID=A0ABZ1JJJ4_9ACTN|nr:hypothetical protein [Streptomyces tauricus]